MAAAIEAVIFDCDGVLFDTVEANKAYYNTILDHFGRPPMTAAQFAVAQMQTADVAMAHLFPAPDLLDAAQAFRRRQTYHAFIKYMRIEPHLRALLKKLRPRFKTAIASNRADTMASVLEIHDLADDFDMVVCALDVARPKPHPEMLLKILAHFGLEAPQAVFVGDSILDQQAADAAGMPFIAYDNPDLSARAHIQSLKELETIGHNSHYWFP